MPRLRIGTYIDTLELENDALREQLKAAKHKIKLLEEAKPYQELAELRKSIKDGARLAEIAEKRLWGVSLEEERNPVY